MVGDRRRSAPAKHADEDSPPRKKRRPTSFGGVVRHAIESSDDDCEEKVDAVKIVEVGKDKRTHPPTSTSGQSSASRKGSPLVA